MKPHTLLPALLAALLASLCGTVHALCLDPHTGVSGYKMPLAAEIRSADAIVVGRVLSAQALLEDPADPAGVTATNVTVRVQETLKGKVPRIIVIRNENTSTRYPIDVGERHLLFVTRTQRELYVNSCGNSDVLPRGRKILGQVRSATAGANPTAVCPAASRCRRGSPAPRSAPP